MNTWDKCKNCGGERGLHQGRGLTKRAPDAAPQSHFFDRSRARRG